MISLNLNQSFKNFNKWRFQQKNFSQNNKLNYLHFKLNQQTKILLFLILNQLLPYLILHFKSNFQKLNYSLQLSFFIISAKWTIGRISEIRQKTLLIIETIVSTIKDNQCLKFKYSFCSTCFIDDSQMMTILKITFLKKCC